MNFRTPVRDLAFSLEHVADLSALRRAGAFVECDSETVAAVLQGAADFADGVLAPISRSGDREGVRVEKGEVYAAPGYRQAWRAYGEAGWMGLAADPTFGGQGLPRSLSAAVMEAVCGANLSFSLCPILSLGAIDAIASHGSGKQRERILPKLISGEWTGTMNLTEPQAGSDLSLVRTTAEPDGGEGFLLYGSKIFITWGDHDCADNIAHLVLARLPDAHPGVKGLSLFLATKHLVDDAGGLGDRNAITLAGLEHKLGIHGSPTCALAFEGAQAELIGPAGGGLACMFTMMNAARRLVGVQGVGLGERAFQMARAYAAERRQGRSPWSTDQTARIIDHPDVRRMLCLMKAKVEAARAICLATAVAADMAEAASDPHVRAFAHRREELLTPIAKAWSTDMAVEVASLGIQVHGGMGYIEEAGAAQLYRDARILPIYEGTNGIQAIDLVVRKLGYLDGEAWRDFANDLHEGLLGLTEPQLLSCRQALSVGLRSLESAAAWLQERRGSVDALAGATLFMKLAGDVLGGALLAKAAMSASRSDPETAFARGKLVLARVYADQVVSGTAGLLLGITSGADALSCFGEAELWAC